MLDQTNFGILCLSRQNLDSPWLHFEAGALSKSLLAGRLIPYLIDLEPDEIQPPLALFQAARADQEGTLALVASIGSLAETGQRTPDQLARSFQLLWPELLRHLNEARATPDAQRTTRDAPDLEELTRLVQHTAARELSVDEQILTGLAALIDQPDAGVVKLYGRPDALEKVGIRGGGAYFDFISRDQQYGYGSDIALRNGQFHTGFAGADYGYFLRLGRQLDFASLIRANEEGPPKALPLPLHAAWRHLWKYRPPSEMNEIRSHQREARGKIIAGVPVSESAAVEQGGCYLLRSIQIAKHDILVGLTVHKVLPD